MVKIEDIPAEVRWMCAAKSSTAIPIAYRISFEKIIGKKKFDEINRMIWIEGGKEAKVLAEALGLLTGNAKEVDDAWGIIGNVLFGPEITWDVIEEDENKRITRITGCSIFNRAKEMGSNPRDCFEDCQAYNRSVVENLNPKYTQRFESGMCLGASFCKSVVELKAPK
jgi:hypothetical protein